MWSGQHWGSYFSWEIFAATALWNPCENTSFLFSISIRCPQRTSNKADWGRDVITYSFRHDWCVCLPVHLYVIAYNICVFGFANVYLVYVRKYLCICEYVSQKNVCLNMNVYLTITIYVCLLLSNLEPHKVFKVLQYQTWCFLWCMIDNFHNVKLFSHYNLIH